MTDTRRPHPRLRSAALTSTAVLAAAALTACGGGSGAGSGAAKAAETPRTKVAVNLSGEQAKAGEPVKVSLTEGDKLDGVTVTDAKGGTLTGQISTDGKSWTSARTTSPGTRYTVEAKAAGATATKAEFGTAVADKVNKVTLAPGRNTTVGIAHPLSIVFDNPVKNRAEVEKRLKVTTSNDTEGSWGWMMDYSGKDRVDWRPKEYWKSGTKVSLKADLNGVDSGKGGGWFVRDYRTNFTIGKNQVVKIDLDGHRLKLVRDGQQVEDVAMSAGTPGGKKASWRGKTVLMSKEGTINMRSETVGLTGSDSYDKMVDYSMRLTWSGMYAHAAPWNKAYFGNTNRSSGCIGMSTSDARSVYDQVQVGDPFEVTGSAAKGTQALNNGYGNWNVSWADWQTRSALKG
ncbi:Ig-like domain-containing protein [Streptomyces sp. CA-294286]|uniref:L,D-transpeptidase n=1 Tax=Streptomyces sp. CA-294286 TaxID=3240070 RepID=UPI003D923215